MYAVQNGPATQAQGLFPEAVIEAIGEAIIEAIGEAIIGEAIGKAIKAVCKVFQ